MTTHSRSIIMKHNERDIHEQLNISPSLPFAVSCLAWASYYCDCDGMMSECECDITVSDVWVCQELQSDLNPKMSVTMVFQQQASCNGLGSKIKEVQNLWSAIKSDGSVILTGEDDKLIRCCKSQFSQYKEKVSKGFAWFLWSSGVPKTVQFICMIHRSPHKISFKDLLILKPT